jgi:hypothetical protein
LVLVVARNSQRRHWEGSLTLDADWDPACHEDAEVGAAAQDRLYDGLHFDQGVLGVVDHEQAAPSSQSLDQPPKLAARGGKHRVGCQQLRDVVHDLVGVGDLGQVDESHTAGIPIGQLCCHRQCQPGLADASDSGKSDESCPSQHPDDFRQLVSPPNERGRDGWQVELEFQWGRRQGHVLKQDPFLEAR